MKDMFFFLSIIGLILAGVIIYHVSIWLYKVGAYCGLWTWDLGVKKLKIQRAIDIIEGELSQITPYGKRKLDAGKEAFKAALDIARSPFERDKQYNLAVALLNQAIQGSLPHLVNEIFMLTH